MTMLGVPGFVVGAGDLPAWLGLALASFTAGAVNSVAGGGTIIAFPVLAAILPAAPTRLVTANATSTVGLWPGAVAAAWAYRGERTAQPPWARHLILPSIAGAAAGSGLVFLLPPHWFDAAGPWLILVAAVLFAAQPRLATLAFSPGSPWPKSILGLWPLETLRFSRELRSRHRIPPVQQAVCPQPAGAGAPPVVAAWLAQFLVAVYGGYFGAGIGILMLALLGSLGMADIHRANGVKNLMGMTVNGTAALVFVTISLVSQTSSLVSQTGLAPSAVTGGGWGVSWPHALVMAGCATGGGLVGSHLARRAPAAVARRLVAVIGFALAGYYLWQQYG